MASHQQHSKFDFNTTQLRSLSYAVTPCTSSSPTSTMRTQLCSGETTPNCTRDSNATPNCTRDSNATQTYESIHSTDLVLDIDGTANRLFTELMVGHCVPTGSAPLPPKTPTSAIPSSPPTTEVTSVDLNETPLELTVDRLHDNPQYVNVKQKRWARLRQDYATLYDKCSNVSNGVYEEYSRGRRDSTRFVPLLYAVIAALVLIIVTLLLANYIISQQSHRALPSISEKDNALTKSTKESIFLTNHQPIAIITGSPYEITNLTGNDVLERVSPAAFETTEATSTTTPTAVEPIVVEEPQVIITDVNNEPLNLVTWARETEEPLAPCAHLQFRCSLGGVSRKPCLYEWERCDGVVDCSDGSDELNCQSMNCFGNFQCRTNGSQCVSLTKVCNGLSDCQDSSDESAAVCASFECQNYEFRCNSGYCIPKEWQCDGDADCADHGDELACASSCSANEHRCPEGYCMPKDWVCNGRADCNDASDEANCVCDPIDHFQCASGQCVGNSLRCDGKEDCPDASDEWNCYRLTTSSHLLMFSSEANDYLFVCRSAQTAHHLDEQALCRRLTFDEESTDRIRDSTVGSSAVVLPTRGNKSVNFDVVPFSSCRSLITLNCRVNVQSQCGLPSPSTNQRRVRRMLNGQLTNPSQWPSTLALRSTRDSFTCTATLIATNWAITSALCIVKTSAAPEEWRVYGTNMQIRRFVKHVSYKRSTLLADFDVMLVELYSTDPDAQATICLPTNQDVAPPPTTCLSIGWGYTQPGGFDQSANLHSIAMDVWSTEKCNSTDHYNGAITEEMVCARDPARRQRPCFNDEGSALLCQIDGRWAIFGVLTAHTCTTDDRHPSVFSKIDRGVVHWLAHVVNSN